MTQKSNVQDAIVDLVKAVRPVLKKYTRHSREQAWDRLTSKRGDQEMKKVLIDPDRPINTFQKLAFKEWLLYSEEAVYNNIYDNRNGYIVPYKVYKNPSMDELKAAMEVDKEILIKGWRYDPGQLKTGTARGFALRSGDIYIWPEHAGYHDTIADKIGVDYFSSFYIYGEEGGFTLSMSVGDRSEIENNSNYRKMVGLEEIEPPPKTTTAATRAPRLTWKDALKPKKVLPGGDEPLPYECTKNGS